MKRQLYIVILLLALTALLSRLLVHRVRPGNDLSFQEAVKYFSENNLTIAEGPLLRYYPTLDRSSENFVVASRCLGYIRREHYLDLVSAKKYYDEAYSHIHQVQSALLRIEILEERADILNLLKTAGSLKLCDEATVEVCKNLRTVDALTKMGILMTYSDSLKVDPEGPPARERERLQGEIDRSVKDIQEKREPRFFLAQPSPESARSQ